MKYYIIFFIKLFFFVALVALCIYLEDYVQRGLGMGIGMLVACIGMAIGEEREEWHDLFCMSGVVLYFGSLCTIGVGIHIEELEDGVILRSPFYTHILERGSHVEEKDLRAWYSQYYSSVDVEKEHFYFLYKDTNLISIYNTHSKVMEVDTTFVIKAEDWGNGTLDYINYHEANYDLRGTRIIDGYKPYKSDRTPDYNTAQ